jgi:NifB/MoaA-like Fe-S oxidoreductase
MLRAYSTKTKNLRAWQLGGFRPVCYIRAGRDGLGCKDCESRRNLP